MLGEPDAKEKLKEEFIEKIMTIAKNRGMLPTADSDTTIGMSKDMISNPVDNVPIMDDEMNIPENFASPPLNNDFIKGKEIDSSSDKGQER